MAIEFRSWQREIEYIRDVYACELTITKVEWLETKNRDAISNISTSSLTSQTHLIHIECECANEKQWSHWHYDHVLGAYFYIR